MYENLAANCDLKDAQLSSLVAALVSLRLINDETGPLLHLYNFILNPYYPFERAVPAFHNLKSNY